MSTQIDLGPVLSVPKGDWNAATTYERLNIVRYNSSSWICNVATSKGVEPTEDSTDWYLQVKDTSSVTSVNGMKGDVVIELTETETPPADDNSNRIATTEWVTDKLGDVDLSGIKEDTIEAAINASSLEVGTGELTSAELVAIIEKGYLPLAGGTITGTIEVDRDTGHIFKKDTKGRMIIRGGTASPEYGASMYLFGIEHPDYPGRLQLQAVSPSGEYLDFDLNNGKATINGQNVVRSVNGFDADGLGDVQINAVSRGNVSANTLTAHGVYFVNGENTALPSGTNGYIVVDSVDGIGFVRQIFYRAGTVGSNDHNIYTRQRGSDGAWGAWVKMLTGKDNGAVESQSIGSEGYVRLVGGLQICWGNCVGGSYKSFPKAFKARPAIVTGHSMSGTDGSREATGTYIEASRFYYKSDGSAGGRYIAFGAWA